MLQTQYGGEVMIRGGEDAFYRGGKTTGIYQEGTQTNVATFHAAVINGDAANPTVAKAVMSNLVSILGRMAAYKNHTVTWDEVVRSQDRIEADLSGLPA